MSRSLRVGWRPCSILRQVTTSRETDKRDPLVSAVILAFNRRDAVRKVLDVLSQLPVDEVILVDNGTDGTGADVASTHPWVRVLANGNNLGIAGRNRGAEAAHGRYLLMLDDDSYPLPGAVDAMVHVLDADERLGVVGGFVRDVDSNGDVLRATGLGTFDWFLRGNRTPGNDGTVETFFFPEGASMFRREAFVQVGGFFEPYFVTLSELDLSSRLLAGGWDVRYAPAARFSHLKASAERDPAATLRLRVRNEIWYFYLHFPFAAAAWRVAFYAAFDFVECLYRRALSAWVGGIADAWRDRRLVEGHRLVLPPKQRKRAELDRLRLHVALLRGQLTRRLSRGATG